MGIKKFKETFPHHTVLTEKDLNGLTLAIDASYEIYRGLKATLKVTTMTDKDGNPTNYIKIILGVIRTLYLAGAKQIWVFDHPKGNPFKIINSQRKAQRNKLIAKIEELKKKKGEVFEYVDDEKLREQLNDPLFDIPKDLKTDTDDEISKLQKQSFMINSQMIERIKKILNAFQIPHIETPHGYEAEGVCAHLTKEGIADAVFTNDMDALLFGAKKLIIRDPSNKGMYFQYILSLILDEYDWKIVDLVHIGIMLGCDFYDDHLSEDDPPELKKVKPRFANLGPIKKRKRLGMFQKKGSFDMPDIAIAVEQFTKSVPTFTIENQDSLKNTKGARPFHSSRKINKLIAWLITELNFEADKLVSLFKKTYKLTGLHAPKSKDKSKNKLKDKKDDSIDNGGD